MEEREASRTVRKHTALRFGSIIGGAGVAVFALVSAVNALRGGDASPSEAVAAQTSQQEAAPAPAAPAATNDVQQAGAPVQAATPVVNAATASLLAVPVGRTDLANGLYAERTGDTVVVYFDTPQTRTRRSDKFEQVVRRTLPIVLGDAGMEAMSAVASGTLVRGGQLLASAEKSPVRITLADGRAVLLTPGLRPGQDGPLVVTYRIVPDQGTPQG